MAAGGVPGTCFRTSAEPASPVFSQWGEDAAALVVKVLELPLPLNRKEEAVS